MPQRKKTHGYRFLEAASRFRLAPSATRLAAIIGICLVFYRPPSVFAQASLAAEDIAEDVAVDVRGVKETFTVIRDALERNQWYYIPNAPRLFEREYQGKLEPEFSLVRYEFSDPDNPNSLLQGGLLQFAATLAVPPEALNQMKQAIVAKFPGTKLEEVRLSGMPLKSARVSLLSPIKGALLTSQPQGGGIGPATASQKMAFLLEMSANGTDVYEQLVRGNTGVPVHVEFIYLGLTPKAGFKVTVNWSQAYRHYSRDDKFRARASWFGLVSANTKVDITKIRNELENANAIKVEAIEGENFDMAKIDDYMQPILKRINDELLEQMKPPSYAEAAKAEVPGSGGFFGGVGYSVAIKNESKVKKGTEEFDFRVQSIVERATIADGFLGIGRYPKEIQDKLLTVAQPGFKSAYLILPSVGDRLGIEEVTFEAAVDVSDAPTYTAQWKPSSGWMYNDHPGTVIPIGLTSLAATLKREPTELKLRTTTRIVTNQNQVIEVPQIIPAFNGRKATTPPTATVDVVQVDGSCLPWGALALPATLGPQLQAVDVQLRCGADKLSTTLRPKRENGRYSQPDLVNFLIPRLSNEAVTANIAYKFIGRDPIQWENNGKNLREPGLGFSIILDATRWPKE